MKAPSLAEFLEHDALRREADMWLLTLEPNKVLGPREVDYFETRLSYALWLDDAIRRDEKEMEQ